MLTSATLEAEKLYYRDKVSQAAPSVAFTLGEYQFADLAALIGGTATDTSWARPDSVDFIEKGVVAKPRGTTWSVTSVWA